MTDEIQKVYYKIGEVAEMLNVPHFTVRLWSNTFGLKVKTGSKRTRYFSRENIDQLKEIQRLLKIEGYTVKGAVRRFNQN